MLAWLLVLRAPGPRVNHDAGLGVAVERDTARGAEHLLAPGPQMIRQNGCCRHEFSVRVAAATRPKGPENRHKTTRQRKRRFRLTDGLSWGKLGLPDARFPRPRPD